MDEVLLVGHNPAFTDFTNELCGSNIKKRTDLRLRAIGVAGRLSLARCFHYRFRGDGVSQTKANDE